MYKLAHQHCPMLGRIWIFPNALCYALSYTRFLQDPHASHRVPADRNGAEFTIDSCFTSWYDVGLVTQSDCMLYRSFAFYDAFCELLLAFYYTFGPFIVSVKSVLV